MAGIDANTKLMLHCNGADESTTFTDDSPSEHTVTAHGTAQLDTAVKKFGTASGMFDGDSDYLSVPDSSDWDVVASNSDNWTIDCWVKHNSTTGDQVYVAQFYTSGEYWSFNQVGGRLRFYVRHNNAGLINTGDADVYITDTDWHHVAYIKVADEHACYLDGQQVSYVQDSDTVNFSASLYVGNGFYGFDDYMDGELDEIRIQKSNYFNASPNSGKTDTITVPTQEYSEVVSITRGRSIIII